MSSRILGGLIAVAAFLTLFWFKRGMVSTLLASVVVGAAYCLIAQP